MRASGVLILLTAIVAVVVAASLSVMTAGSFQERWQYHTERWEQAEEYLKQPHCRRNSARTKLKGWHKCDESERVLSSYPVWFALLDVSHSIPPLVGQLAISVREDLVRIALTTAILGGLYSMFRQYTKVSDKSMRGSYSHNSLPMYREYKILDDY